jgi:peptidoglycan hydrolase CwlO-like protein
MTPMVAVVVATLSALAAITAAILTYKASKNATKVEDRKVDLSTYQQAVEFYDKQLERVNGQVDRLNTQLDRVTSQLESEQVVSGSLREKVRILQSTVDTLTQTITDLRNHLAKHGVTVPIP